MEKDGAEPKKSSKNLSQNQNAADKPKIVLEDSELAAAVASKTPFELDKRYTELTTPQSSLASMIPIMHALHDNTTVKHLIIKTRSWDTSELKEFVKCLTGINQGINKITLHGHNFSANFIEALTKILKSNRRIKALELLLGSSSTEIHKKGFVRLCDGMEYYHFKELLVTWSWVSYPVEYYKTLFESLKYNQSIKCINITGEHISHGFNSLCNTLISNPTITKLIIEQFQFTESCQSLNQVLKANTIKALTIKGTNLEGELKFIAEGLKVNTSIIYLTLECQQFYHGCQMNWKVFKKILKKNKTIKKLDISYNDNLTIEQLLNLSFGSNKTITDLNITYCSKIKNIRPILLQLMNNSTLKTLAISAAKPRDHDYKMLEEFLSANTPLTALAIHPEYPTVYLKDKVFEAVANGLEVNRTLRKLGIIIEHIRYSTVVRFVEALKRNNTLLELHTTNLKNMFLNTHRPPKGSSDIDDIFLDLLNTNKTLRYITGADDYPHLAERLKSNRDTQDKIISDTCTLIRMIVMKPHSFILPIEIWLKIFSYVSYDCTPFNFEQFFSKLLT